MFIKTRKIEVVPHSHLWSEKYQNEGKKLKVILGKNLHSIHHIGSTALIKSYAKPIIDIMLLVFSLKELDSLNRKMQDLGYVPMGEYGITGRRYFTKDFDGKRAFQIHAFHFEKKGASKYLLFRDYLNNYPKEAMDYSKFKQELAEKYPEDIELYTKAKAPYIEELFKRIKKNPISYNYDSLKDRIDISPYRSAWHEGAQEEIKRIRELDQEKLILDAQHIGSTSIKGLSAKPVLDLMLGVESMEKGCELIKPLESLGYLFWADNPDKTRLFFVKGMPPHGTKRTHHVHIFKHKDARWRMRVLFRDCLNSDPQTLKKYKELKENLAEFYAYDRENYTHLKSKFVEGVLKKAGYLDEVFR